MLHKNVWALIAILHFGSLAVCQNPSVPAFPGDIHRVAFITGQVVISDGTKLSESAAVQIVCGGRIRAELYTDTSGTFNFDLAKLVWISGPQPADVSRTVRLAGDNPEWNDCSARAVLAGFSSESLDFGRHLQELGIADIGRITLHPVNPGAKTSLSVSSLLAPKPARKAMDKGLKLEEQRRWPEAEQSFRKAIEIYPQYAAAWSELGRMQYVQQNYSSAHESFQRAVVIDPQYVKPYLGLVQLAVDAHDWPEAVRASDKALALDSASYPGMWLMNAAAQYNLRNYDAAETSVRNGKRADTEHRIKNFQLLWMQIIAARDSGATFVGQNPRFHFGINKHVWGDSDPSDIWLH